MKNTHLFFLWGSLFALCSVLGFIPEPGSALQNLLTILSVIFFIPPAVLLYHTKQKKDLFVIRLIRNLSALSLLLTLILLILNFLTVFSGEFLGKVLYYLLVIVSSPMICSGYWALSLFFWACLLTVSIKQIKEK